LEKNGFEEVMLGRMLSADEWHRVVTCLGPIGEELERETYAFSGNVLCHWQCEPYYLALETLKDTLPRKIFDRSGWSFRNEARQEPYRYHQFQRLEAVWRGTPSEVASTLESCLNTVEAMLLARGLKVTRVERPEEVADSCQKRVVDLVLGNDVEIAGFHLHGRAFVEKFWPEAPTDHESGCCGISLSRLARLLTDRT
jgi:seryl-tRNA synthetase